MTNIQDLIEKTIVKIIKKDDSELLFICDDNTCFFMGHNQECCETVYIEDITGDLEDLIGSKILIAEESSNHTDQAKWTFYKLATFNGYVDIRFNGSSWSGHYSWNVDCYLLDNFNFNEYLTKYPHSNVFTKIKVVDNF